MVQLLESDIRTSEMLAWTGVHLFHFHASSCSQKTRIVLNLKGVDWQAHPVDISRDENLGEWFLGINPRGLVPVLVIDGAVHIESNDIVSLLDRRFPEPRQIPEGREAEMSALLRHEDELHHDLRTISFRFTQPRGREPKSKEALAGYRAGGSGTVLGDADPSKAAEIAFWERIAPRRNHRRGHPGFGGALPAILRRLRSPAGLRPLPDGRAVEHGGYRLVHLCSTGLIRCGWPVKRLHPNLFAWFRPLRARPEFAREVEVSPEIQRAVDENQRRQREAGKTLIDVAGL